MWKSETKSCSKLQAAAFSWFANTYSEPTMKSIAGRFFFMFLIEVIPITQY